MNTSFFPAWETTLASVRTQQIPADRQAILQPVITYIQSKWATQQVPQLHFICTHNSRRSQFAQIWAQALAFYFDVPLQSYSGGVEVTAMNERAVTSLQRAGFQVSSTGSENPIYTFTVSHHHPGILAFSKLYDHSSNPSNQFAAVMTCSDADENCPFIPGTECRLPVRYHDPKVADGTPNEEPTYDERSLQIAAELWFVLENALRK